MSNSQPVVLCILDGWGYREDNNNNAINQAVKPVWDRLWHDRPHSLIRTSGAAVGLPAEQMGNSEVGHLNLGAGRVVYQEFTRVSRSIRTGSFFSNQTLTKGVDLAVESNKAVHIMGLLSPGGVHSHETHIQAMAKLAVERGAKNVFLHIFLDGRDTPPKSAESSILQLEEKLAEIGGGQIVSMVGRYYAMDRDNRWARIQSAYQLMVDGDAEFTATSAIEGLSLAYDRNETDEFVKATSIVSAGQQAVTINDGDVLFFMNYRSDRARELTRPFIEEDFDRFERQRTPKLSSFISLTEYNESFDIPVAFPPERLNNVMGAYLSSLGMTQLRLAETEKYAHVTFFFNGGKEDPFEGEERVLVSSPDVATYDLKPEMSAHEVTDELVSAIESGKYDVIVCNYANADMVGHTGKIDAAIKAVETLDQCLGRVISSLHRVGGQMLVTADHGNADQMLDESTGQAHTAHTSNLVPLIYVGDQTITLDDNGALCDIAPSILSLLGLPQPSEMTGHSLIMSE